MLGGDLGHRRDAPASGTPAKLLPYNPFHACCPGNACCKPELQVLLLFRLLVTLSLPQRELSQALTIVVWALVAERRNGRQRPQQGTNAQAVEQAPAQRGVPKVYLYGSVNGKIMPSVLVGLVFPCCALPGSGDELLWKMLPLCKSMGMLTTTSDPQTVVLISPPVSSAFAGPFLKMIRFSWAWGELWTGILNKWHTDTLHLPGSP